MFTIAFFLGLVSNLHCISMCGPLMMAFYQNKPVSDILLHQSGRIFVYVLLGLLAGLLGAGARFFGVQQAVSMILGFSIILFLIISFLKNISYKLPGNRLYSNMKNFFSRFLGRDKKRNAILLGIINGFLPCGMVYFALSTAIVQSSLLNSGLFMLIFGFSTLPAMIFAPAIQNHLGKITRFRFSRFKNYLLVITAFLLIIRGLSLGIPYLSPQNPDATKGVSECVN